MLNVTELINDAAMRRAIAQRVAFPRRQTLAEWGRSLTDIPFNVSIDRLLIHSPYSDTKIQGVRRFISWLRACRINLFAS
jgi:hypothetical protein